jgi:hypothetical protein
MQVDDRAASYCKSSHTLVGSAELLKAMTWMQLVARRDRAVCICIQQMNQQSIAWWGVLERAADRAFVSVLVLNGPLWTTETRCAPQCTHDPAAEDVRSFWGVNFSVGCSGYALANPWTLVLASWAVHVIFPMGSWQLRLFRTKGMQIHTQRLHSITRYPSPYMDSIMQG